jgi:hypothetical protein
MFHILLEAPAVWEHNLCQQHHFGIDPPERCKTFRTHGAGASSPLHPETS